MNALTMAVLAVITAGLGTLVGLLTVKSMNRKTDRETDGVIVAAAERVVTLLNAQVTRLETELDKVRQLAHDNSRRLEEKRRELSQVESYVKILKLEIERMGGNPPPFPVVD